MRDTYTSSRCFTHSRVFENPAREFWLARLVAAYQPDLVIPSTPSEFRITVRIADQFCNDQMQIPRTGFLKTAMPVSVRIQETLRLWAPYLYFDDPRWYRQAEAASQMIVYGACRVYTPQSKESYSFHLLDNKTWPSILRSAGMRLKEWFPRLLPVLQHAKVPAYSPLLELEKLLHFTDRGHNQLNTMIDRERALIELFVRRLSRELIPLKMRRFSLYAERPLRRFYSELDCSALLPLLEVEVQRVLAFRRWQMEAREVRCEFVPVSEEIRREIAA